MQRINIKNIRSTLVAKLKIFIGTSVDKRTQSRRKKVVIYADRCVNEIRDLNLMQCSE